jgi:CubicO group peptidase (beta-lactamase class C family)
MSRTRALLALRSTPPTLIKKMLLLGITPETFDRVTAPPPVARRNDEVLGVTSYFSLGFLRPGPDPFFGSSPRAFGAPGAGGSFAFADPDAHLGFAYVMNRMDFYLVNDPREKVIRDAVYRAMARLTNRPEARDDAAGSRQLAAVSTAT